MMMMMMTRPSNPRASERRAEAEAEVAEVAGVVAPALHICGRGSVCATAIVRALTVTLVLAQCPVKTGPALAATGSDSSRVLIPPLLLVLLEPLRWVAQARARVQARPARTRDPWRALMGARAHLVPKRVPQRKARCRL